MHTKVAGTLEHEVPREIDGITEFRSGPATRFYQLDAWVHNEMDRLEQGALVATITRSDVFGFVERSEAESNSVAMMCNRASFVNSVNINDASVHGVCVTNTTLQQQRTL